MDNDSPVERLAKSLVVTGVIGSTRSMRWTSPDTGACATLFESGVYTVTRRTEDGVEVITTGRAAPDRLELLLTSPQGLEARLAAARGITAVDHLDDVIDGRIGSGTSATGGTDDALPAAS